MTNEYDIKTEYCKKLSNMVETQNEEDADRTKHKYVNEIEDSTLIIPINVCHYSELRSAVTI